MLEEVEPDLGYHHDLVPPDWYAEARRVLAAARRAWVFGGMGWWNDVSFEDDALLKDYESVSVDLYSAVVDAIAAAAGVRVD